MIKFTNKKQKLSKGIVVLNNTPEELKMIEALKEKIKK